MKTKIFHYLLAGLACCTAGITITSCQNKDIEREEMILLAPDGSQITGTLDGDMVTLSGLGHSLFNTIDGSATVKNVILDEVGIDIDGNAGAIAKEATGNSRISRCVT